MAIIGKFKKTNLEAYSGVIQTLTLSLKTDIVPVNHPTNDRAPNFRIVANGVEVGAGWSKQNQHGAAYIAVSLDDPSFAATVRANLIAREGDAFDLIWSRER